MSKCLLAFGQSDASSLEFKRSQQTVKYEDRTHACPKDHCVTSMYRDTKDAQYVQDS